MSSHVFSVRFGGELNSVRVAGVGSRITCNSSHSSSQWKPAGGGYRVHVLLLVRVAVPGRITLRECYSAFVSHVGVREGVWCVVERSR